MQVLVSRAQSEGAFVANRPRVNPVLKPELERTQIDGENALGRFAQSRGIKRTEELLSDY